MKKIVLSFALALSLIAGTSVSFAAPMGGPHGGMRGYNDGPPKQHYDMFYGNNHHHHHHRGHQAPPPMYYMPPPPPPMVVNRVVRVERPNASYYFSDPYLVSPYTYSYNNWGYYPNKTLTVRTKHVLFSI